MLKPLGASSSSWWVPAASGAIVSLMLFFPVTFHLLSIHGQPHPSVCVRHGFGGGLNDRGLPLPHLVMFVGPEGSGHDLFETIFNSLPSNLSIARFDPATHLTNDPDQVTVGEKDRSSAAVTCPQLPYARQVIDYGVRMTEALKGALPGASGYYVRARDPFPMGRIRTPLARPDLISVAAFHNVIYSLKAIVLVRNETDCVQWSVVRRFHSKDVGLQVRLIEDSLVYMDASVRALPCGTYLMVDVDALLAEPKAYAARLASFLDIPGLHPTDVEIAIELAKSDMQAKNEKIQVDGAEIPLLDGHPIPPFFEQRDKLWPLYRAVRQKGFFLPKQPASWPH